MDNLSKNRVIVDASDLSKVQLAMSALNELIKKCQPLEENTTSSSVFVRSGDYVGLALEILARQEAGFEWRNEAPTVKDLAILWSDRVGWYVDEAVLGRQLKNVPSRYKKDIRKRASMIDGKARNDQSVW